MCVRKRIRSGLLCCVFAACGFGCGQKIEISAPAPAETQPVITGTTAVTNAVTTAPETSVSVNPKWAEQVRQQGEKGHVIENVPHYMQFNSYLTACESLAAVSVLRYYGIDMTPDLFLDGYLPLADYPQDTGDGELHGESPWEYFIGDPMRLDGFGCYSGALVRGINKIKKGLAVPLRYCSLEKLCTDYIDKGQPVIIWATMYMEYPQDSIQWYLPDGHLFTFKAPEHALVLIGYDENYYYFSDSLQYQDVVCYGREMTERAYSGLLLQAVVIDPLVLETVPDFWRIPPEEETENAEP